METLWEILKFSLLFFLILIAFMKNVFFFVEINRKVYRSCRHVPPSSGDGEYSIDPTLKKKIDSENRKSVYRFL